ncbi:hypothetical protein YC2023_004657 [Brassica napus]
MTGTQLLDELVHAVRSLVQLYQLNYVWLDPRKGCAEIRDLWETRLLSFYDFRIYSVTCRWLSQRSGTSGKLGTQLNVVGDGLRVITAHAGKSTEEKSGYSFVHCKVTGTGTGIYLGRAWMSHPKVVYAYTDMSSVVNPSGWH